MSDETPQSESAPAAASVVRLRDNLCRHWDLWTFVALALLTVLTYWPLTSVGLLSDDWGIASSQVGGAPLSSFHGHWLGGGGEGSFYRPFSRILLHVEGKLFPDSGELHHIVSLLLHIATALFVFLAFRRLRLPVAGLLAAGYALIHPANVASVGWVSSQTDLLVLMFFAATIYASLGRLTNARLGVSAALAAATYFSKDTAIFLGPSLAGGALLLAWMGGTEEAPRKRLYLFAAIHAALWVVYMLARKIFLGQFLLTVGPAEMSLPQMSENLIACFDYLLRPYLPFLFAPRDTFALLNFPLFFTFLLFPILLLVAAVRKEKIFAIAILLFGLSLGTIISSFDQTVHLFGSERYFYYPLWAFAALAGVGLSPLVKNINRVAGLTAVLLILGILILRQMFMVGTALTDFQRAGAVRDAIEAELREAQENHPGFALAVGTLPDRVQSAFVFRNGFREFLNAKFDNPPERFDMENPEWREIPDGAVIYTLNYVSDDKRPFVRYDEQLTRGIQQLKAQAAAPRQSVQPVVFDFRDPNITRTQFYFNEDIQMIGLEPGKGLRLKMVGRDPNIGLPLSPGFNPSQYSKLTVEMDFLSDFGSPDRLDLNFLPLDQSEGPVTIAEPFTIQEKAMAVEIDLSKNLKWRTTQQLTWLRLDPTEAYRGEVTVIRIAFE